MTMRVLLTTLLFAVSCLMGHGQVYRVPPRKEICHKIKNYPQHDNPQQESTRAAGDYIMQEFPTMGEVRGLVLLVSYKDVPFSLSADSIRTLLQNRYDGENYTEQIEHRGFSQVDGDTISLRATIPGSARDYFREMSRGKFTPRFDVVGPIALDSTRAYYGANDKSGFDMKAPVMITEACRKAFNQELADFAHYDSDYDGIVDFVYVVYAGSDEAQTAMEDCVWAHASTVSLTLPDGMKVSRYACSGELFVDLKSFPAGIGTFVHEFSHILGLPDFYNTKAEDFTMDVWSVMDKPLTDINYSTATGKTSLHFRGGAVIQEADSSLSSSIRYDLQGRPIASPTQGVYIQGGKKHLHLR